MDQMDISSLHLQDSWCKDLGNGSNVYIVRILRKIGPLGNGWKCALCSLHVQENLSQVEQ
jgi:hypothetical protein